MIEQPFRQTNMEAVLQQLIDRGGFIGAVVASENGLPLAMVGKANTVMIAAVAASMKDLAERAHAGLTEIVTSDDSGRKIISRYFLVGDDVFLLSVEVSMNKAHRQSTGRAIRALKKILTA